MTWEQSPATNAQTGPQDRAGFKAEQWDPWQCWSSTEQTRHGPPQSLRSFREVPAYFSTCNLDISAGDPAGAAPGLRPPAKSNE